MALPLGDLEADYRALRQDCGAVVGTRDVVVVAGPQAEEYLQGQCSQDLAGLEDGAWSESLVLEPDGKLNAVVRVLRRRSEEFVLETEPGCGAALCQRLSRFRLRTKVTVEPSAWPVIRMRGPRAPALAGPPGLRAGAGAEVWVLETEWAGNPGVDLLGPGARAARPAGVRECSPESLEPVRIESGIPVSGRDLDGRTIPAEAGAAFLERTVSFTKGCYTGQELVARLEARGNRVPRRLCGLVLAESEAAGDVGEALAGCELVAPPSEAKETGKPLGRITSAAWCPGLRAPAALGYVHRSVPAGATLSVGGPGAGNRFSGRPVEVRELPLVPGRG